MSAIVNARDVLLQAASTRLLTVASPTNQTVDFSLVNGATKPENNATVGATWNLNLSGQPTALVNINASEGNKLAGIAAGADVTLSAVNGGLSVTGGGITLSGGGAIKGGQTDYATGTGFFLGYSGGAYKFSIGNASSYLQWTGAALEINGNIGGTSNIDITGQARFSGTYPGVGSVSTSVYGNYANNAVRGVTGQSSATLDSHGATGVGVYGIGNGAEASGVMGTSAMRIGVGGVSSGASPDGIGVRAYNTSSGYGLYAYSNSGYAIYCDGSAYFASSIFGTLFSGDVLGNVTGNVTGSSGSCTGNAATATTADSATFATNAASLSGTNSYGTCTMTNGVEAFRATGNSGSTNGLRGWNSNGCGGVIGLSSNAHNFYADGGAASDYGTFTGGHDALLPKGASAEPGDIMVDVVVIARYEWSQVITEVARSSGANQKGAIGIMLGTFPMDVYQPNALYRNPGSYEAIASTHDYAVVNALGEGQMNVCGEGGNIEIGDLIVTSSIPGKGMKQSDDIVRGCTVAKAREAVTFDSPTQVKIVACIYMCG
jgi:hypothetical protein